MSDDHKCKVCGGWLRECYLGTKKEYVGVFIRGRDCGHVARQLKTLACDECGLVYARKERL